MHKIAILTDSGTDVPKEYIDKYGIYVLPLGINYEAVSYKDRVDITPEQVIDRLEIEVPKTSLPNISETLATLRSIRDAGISEIIAITISSGLSGTFNMIRTMSHELDGLDVRLIDTKNIGIGAGMTVIRAAELTDTDLSLDEIEKKLLKSLPTTKVFFCVDTLKYLQKGGRIGLVTAAVGTLLGIRPVISCNDDGVYYTVKKARGAKQALQTAVEQVVEMTKGAKRFNLLVAHGGAESIARQLGETLCERLPNFEKFVFAPVSPALVVHTGPGLVGVGVQIY